MSHKCLLIVKRGEKKSRMKIRVIKYIKNTILKSQHVVHSQLRKTDERNKRLNLCLCLQSMQILSHNLTVTSQSRSNIYLQLQSTTENRRKKLHFHFTHVANGTFCFQLLVTLYFSPQLYILL